MRGSGVTAARSCLQPLVSASRYLAIHALPGDPLYFIVEAKSRVKEVYTQTCTLLSQQGMRDCELFGLAILSDGEYLFVDPENKLSKYAPKNWRNSHTYGLDSSGRPAFVLYFRVRFYIDTPLLLSDETTRHHYYLQLRDNVVRHGGGVESLHPHHPLHEPSIVTSLLVLAGLALQADLGDYSEERHRPHAGSVGVLAAQHREYSGLSREEAELQYIREAVLLEAPLNAHLYRLRRSKNEAGPGRILLAICARGVRIYAEEETPRVFAWNNIGKLSFDRKKFEIRAVDQPEKLTLYSGCDDKSKLLLGLCRDTHQFSMAIAPRVNEAMKREEEERKVLRDCYMYPTRCKLSLATRGARGDQRISVISSTSSNTTSGIVSDRVHSEDEPDTAPASTECLPRLTLETISYSDGQSRVLNGTNGDADNHSMPPSSVSVIDEIDNSDATSTSVVLRLASSAATAAEGSQCSSSCSTVVVVNTSTGGPSRMRRASATSSLELGYSHTAQNSAISTETASFPGAIYDRCKKTGKYTGTDIASETSGVYTLRSSEIQDERIGDDLYLPTGDTNASSAASDVCALSSVQSTTDEASITSGFYTIHSGLRSESSYTEDVGAEDQEPIYSLCKGDDDEVSLNRQLEDSRSRSNSILSVSSFRGDGSDPSKARPLLSADELSDLIVGRYPPRKTISNSMDSDCDYVTMPPPPPPPPRTDSDRQLPPPYPIESIDYATINVSKRSGIPELAREREPPPPPPYNKTCSDFVPLPPRRTDPPPPPPSYTSSRERIQIPPPTPPRNDAVTPREPPPPPPPYPDMSATIGSVTKVVKIINDVAGNIAPPKPPPRIQPPTYPGDKMKPTPVHAPVAALVVGPNNYLDVHASRSGPVLLPYLTTPPPPPPLPPPPIIHPRQPPPPPPPPPPPSTQPASSLATVYTSQVSRSQIEQYKQQLYSDVDYVMFPLKDPAVSKQEYIDAKQGSLLAAMAAYPPPPYPSFSKSSVMYRSTPYLPGSSFSSQSKYASNQNLSSSDTGSSSGNYLQGNLNSHYAASTSSLYSGATCSSTGSHSLRREPPVPTHPHTLNTFSRTKSDENILKCLNTLFTNKMQSLPQSKHRRLPPPPPPPPYEIQNLDKNQPLPSSSSVATSSLATTTTNKLKKLSNGIEENDERKSDDMLDIRTLREKSRNLDLPLISALCNDQYLLKQTKAFVLPKHPSEITSTAVPMKSGTRSNGTTSSRSKYPVSGLSTTQIQKPLRKSSTSTHKHPSEIKSNAYKVNVSSTGVSTIKKDFTRTSHS